MALTPKQIVQELDRHIVGQKEAKKAVALALRNRCSAALMSGRRCSTSAGSPTGSLASTSPRGAAGSA